MRRCVALPSTFSRRLQIIKLVDKLAEALLEELFSWDPRIEFVIQACDDLRMSQSTSDVRIGIKSSPLHLISYCSDFLSF